MCNSVAAAQAFLPRDISRYLANYLSRHATHNFDECLDFSVWNSYVWWAILDERQNSTL